MLLNSGPSSFSSSTDIGGQVVLYQFDSNSEAQQLYWAGRLRVSIDLLLMKNHQSQLDLVRPPYQSLHHRSRSLFNILQDDRPPTIQVASKEEHRFFAVNPKRPNRRPPQLVTKEYDLEQKIDVEIRIREGTTKLLAACQHPSQALEAAKTLHTSNERMNVYMTELQSRKRDLLQSRPPPASIVTATSSSRSRKSACPARLGLTDLRFPLMWKDTDHFKNRGDYRRFAVFCLAKVGTEVMDTSLITPVDRSATDITFPDALVFTSAQPDFKMKLEVYSCMLQDDLSIASTPRKLQKSLHSSISRTLGRKLSATLKDPHGLKNDAIGPKFDLVATVTLGLEEVHDSVKSHDLVLENLENPCHQLPLFDHFCCRLAAEPECLSLEQTASVTLKSPPSTNQSGKSSKSDPPPVWAALGGFNLALWKKKEHRQDKNRSPLLSVSLGQGATMAEERGEVVLTAMDDDDEEKRVEFRCSDAHFISALSQRIVDASAWGPKVSRSQMVIHSPQPTNGSPNSRWAPRTGSLYEDIPLFEEPQKSYSRRPTVHEVFSLSHNRSTAGGIVDGLDNGYKSSSRLPSQTAMHPPPSPPSPPNTRSRSSSTSTSSGSLPSWGSMRGLPNFFRFTRTSIRK
ncbi:rhotekin-like isoform X1 [Daphnia pulex]|uniref:rhotekin-like isoform X1 n=1 Tax=Daphnia pulex TaxID=6669 RepID=UPI001EDF96DA|nr:rhotekin-like isoform X1 [Daphnia pulex]